MEIWPVVVAFAIVIGLLVWDRRKDAGGSDVKGEIRKLESRMKIVETEWADAYDKLGRLASRLTKERGLLEKAGAGAGDGGSSTTTTERPRSRMQILSRGGQ